MTNQPLIFLDRGGWAVFSVAQDLLNRLMPRAFLGNHGEDVMDWISANEFNSDTEHFKAEEGRSATAWDAPLGSRVVVRLDGIRATGRYLRFSDKNERYAKALRAAVQQCFVVWKTWSSDEANPYLTHCLAVGDEVNFVIGTGPNRYERRLLKMCTTLAGTLSASMTGYWGRRLESGHPEVMSFDARPLILTSSQDVVRYLQHRTWSYVRVIGNRYLRSKAEGERGGGKVSEYRLIDSMDEMRDRIRSEGAESQIQRQVRDAFFAVARPKLVPEIVQCESLPDFLSELKTEQW